MSLMIVIGDCDRKMLDSVKIAMFDKLSRTEEQSVRFIEFNDYLTSSEGAAEAVFSELNSDCANDGRISVVYLYDGTPENADHAQALSNAFNRVTFENGLTSVFNMVIMPNEFPTPQKRYIDIIDKIPFVSASNAAGFGGGVPYTGVYLLSDKNKNFKNSAATRIDACGMLLMYLYSNNFTVKGIYTAGTSKRSISASEMRRYTEHATAIALRDCRLPHPEVGDFKKLCEECIPGPAVFSAVERIISEVGNLVSGSFCYMDERVLSSVEEDEDASIKAINNLCSKWRNNVIERLDSMPFVKEASAFFDSHSFKDFTEELAISLKKSVSGAREIKAGMFGNKKLVAAYNDYKKKQERLLNALADKVSQAMYEQKGYIDDAIRALERKVDECCGEFEMDKQWVDDFKSAHQDLALTVETQIMRDIAFRAIDCVSGFNNKSGSNPENWRAFIDRVVAHTVNAQVLSDLVRMDAERPVGEWISHALPDLDAQASAYLVRNKVGDVGLPMTRMYCLPRRFNTSGIEQTLGNQHYDFNISVVPVNDPDYANEEELAVFRLDTHGESFAEVARQLTAFADVHPKLNQVKAVANDAEPEFVPVTAAPFVPEIVEEPVKEEKSPWNLRVIPNGQRFFMYFNWLDAKCEKMSCVITPASGGHAETVFVSRDDFNTQSFVDITEKIGNGKYSIELKKYGEVMDTAVIIGRTTAYRFTRDTSDYKLDQNVVLNKVKISYDSNETGADPLDVLLNNLILVMDGSNGVKLGPPSTVKKREISWLIYTDSNDLSLRINDKEISGYSVQLA